MAFWNIQHILNKIFDSATNALNIKVTGSNSSGAPRATAPTNAQLMGGQYNSSAPALTNGQMGEVQMDSKGNVLIGIRDADGEQVNVIVSSNIADAAIQHNGLAVMNYNMGYIGNSVWDRVRVASWKTQVGAAVGAASTTPIWTPAAGKKFRFMGFIFTATAAGVFTFQDAASNVIAMEIGANDIGRVIAVTLPGNGYISTAINQVLNLNASAAATIRVTPFGTEE